MLSRELDSEQIAVIKTCCSSAANPSSLGNDLNDSIDVSVEDDNESIDGFSDSLNITDGGWESASGDCHSLGYVGGTSCGFSDGIGDNGQRCSSADLLKGLEDNGKKSVQTGGDSVQGSGKLSYNLGDISKYDGQFSRKLGGDAGD